MKISREDAVRHIGAGRSVAFVAPGQRSRRMQRERDIPPAGQGDYILLVDDRGDLTREAMELAIREGGSVLKDGKLIERVEDLPTDADLARGDEQRTRQVREGLLGEMARLHGELAKLNQPGGGRADAGGATAQAAPPGDLSSNEREELERLRADRRREEERRAALHHAEDVQEGAAPAPAPEPPPLFAQPRDEPPRGKGKGK